MKTRDGSSNRPLWTEEFSVHAAEDAYVLRRQFTKFLVLTSFGMLAGNATIWLRSLASAAPAGHPERVVAPSASVAPGTVKLFSYPTANDPAIPGCRSAGPPGSGSAASPSAVFPSGSTTSPTTGRPSPPARGSRAVRARRPPPGSS